MQKNILLINFCKKYAENCTAEFSVSVLENFVKNPIHVSHEKQQAGYCSLCNILPADFFYLLSVVVLDFAVVVVVAEVVVVALYLKVISSHKS